MAIPTFVPTVNPIGLKANILTKIFRLTVTKGTWILLYKLRVDTNGGPIYILNLTSEDGNLTDIPSSYVYNEYIIANGGSDYRYYTGKSFVIKGFSNNTTLYNYYRSTAAFNVYGDFSIWSIYAIRLYK